MSYPRSRLVGWRMVGPALIVGLGAVGLYAWLDHAAVPDASSYAESFPWARTPGGSPTGETILSNTDPTLAAPTSAGATGEPAVTAGASRPFRADANGRLVVDQPMRLQIESLLALNNGPGLAAALESDLAGLPPAAAARARELLAQYQAYQDAQRQSFPPGQAPLLPEEGLAQLNALQALRATYLGSDNARQMFAEDDAVARRLLELMREDTSTSISMAEKAVRAQARYDSERNRVQP
ncbi:lipase chaperone protein [Roseateles sp. YR242]|uniref:lipase secretion chaperone n=1 Tax=Roseateles sp. YR242 TaxID=1855305 RepID=UPI0008C0D340|nr:lipase secretion chaperone [Roseateles sp. YR242]SEL40058.1 lipase chaperone protein [Roseateles sp. YR242]